MHFAPFESPAKKQLDCPQHLANHFDIAKILIDINFIYLNKLNLPFAIKKEGGEDRKWDQIQDQIRI